MSTPARNLSTALVFRQLVSSYLDHEGLSATPKPHRTRPSDALEHALEPDIIGIPGLWLDVTARLRHEISIDLNDARRGADLAGMDVACFVQHRGGRDVEESFVILSLRDFTKLLKAPPVVTHDPRTPMLL